MSSLIPRSELSANCSGHNYTVYCVNCVIVNGWTPCCAEPSHLFTKEMLIALLQCDGGPMKCQGLMALDAHSFKTDSDGEDSRVMNPAEAVTDANGEIQTVLRNW